MKKHVYVVRTGRPGTKQVAVESMREPRQRMPIGHVRRDGPNRRERPHYGFPSQSGPDMGIRINVGTVIKLCEGMRMDREIYRNGHGQQQKRQPDRGSSGRLLPVDLSSLACGARARLCGWGRLQRQDVIPRSSLWGDFAYLTPLERRRALEQFRDWCIRLERAFRLASGASPETGFAYRCICTGMQNQKNQGSVNATLKRRSTRTHRFGKRSRAKAPGRQKKNATSAQVGGTWREKLRCAIRSTE